MLSSVVRTVVPILVGLIATVLLNIGVTLSPDAQTLLAGIIAAAYYALVRVLERKWPALTWLLGSGEQPAAYSPDGTVTPTPEPPAVPANPPAPPAP
jgi:hypothetical protein